MTASRNRTWTLGEVLIGLPILVILASLVLVSLFWLVVGALLVYPVCWVLVLAGRALIRWNERRGTA